MDVMQQVSTMRAHVYSGATRPYAKRQATLKNLELLLKEHQSELEAALTADLGKSSYESYLSEIAQVYSELNYAQRHLKRWMRAKRVRPSLAQIPARCRVYAEPLGVVLIIAPWNYPLLLALSPLISALAAGNAVVLKLSQQTPKVSALLKKLLSGSFDSTLLTVVDSRTSLLTVRYDYIFFTGSSEVGKQVMAAAAEYLTPVTLELGGKSPAIVDQSADLALAAKRIAFGKLLNAGQTCIAPDYLLVHSAVKDAFVVELHNAFKAALGSRPLTEPSYPTMISEAKVTKLFSALKGTELLFGGTSQGKRIEPTLFQCEIDHPLMQEEIFGPLLPLLIFDGKEELLAFLQGREKPLALYLFTRDRAFEKQVLTHLSFGGGVVNDTILQIANPRLPFGGVGNSGHGSYHGRYGFETFSHRKSVVKKGPWFDLPLRYHPYSQRSFKWLQRLLR